MRYESAAQAWHDAFDPRIGSIDTREMIDTFGVQFSARGADGKIMDHAQQALIQQAVEKLKSVDKVAWAWGMYAYAPMGTAHGFERAILHGYFRDLYNGRVARRPSTPKAHMAVMVLARIAYEDAAQECRGGGRKCRRYSDIARIIGVTPESYKTEWLKHFLFFKDSAKDLPARALPPIARVIGIYNDRIDAHAQGRDIAGLTQDLRDAIGLVGVWT